MKITKNTLKQIIKEEYEAVMKDQSLTEGNEVSRMITKLELVLSTVDGAMGYIENPAAEERFQRALDIGQELWEEMHNLLAEEKAKTEPVVSLEEGSAVATPKIKASPGAAEVYIDGLGTMVEQGGAPIYVEYYDGAWVLNVWADASSEDPTHRIDLSKAVDNEAGNKELSENTGSSNQEEINKILDLIENDPEFEILGQFKDKFLKYMQSGGDPLSALEAASPEWRPVQKALEKLRTVIKPTGPKTPMGMKITREQLLKIIKEELQLQKEIGVYEPVEEELIEAVHVAWGRAAEMGMEDSEIWAAIEAEFRRGR